MPLETATYISDLNPANPVGTDPIAFVDEHIRLLKAALKATFPNINGPVTLTEEKLNLALDKSGDTLTGLVKASADAPTDPLHLVTKGFVEGLVSGLQTAVTAAKADKNITLTANGGLTGGGDLSANRTVSIADLSGLTPGAYGSVTKIPKLTVNAKGQVTAAEEVTFGGTMVMQAKAASQDVAPNATWVFDASTDGTPIAVHAVLSTYGGENVSGNIFCRWLDASGNEVGASTLLSSANRMNGNDGGSGMYNAETAYIPMLNGAKKLEFRATNHMGKVEIFGITRYSA